MKIVKYIFLLLLGAVGWVNIGFGQNPYWVFPPNYIDFTEQTPIVKPLNFPSIGIKTESSNAIFNLDGTPKIVNNDMSDFDKNGTFIGIISNRCIDFSFIPIPGTCNSFRSLFRQNVNHTFMNYTLNSSNNVCSNQISTNYFSDYSIGSSMAISNNKYNNGFISKTYIIQNNSNNNVVISRIDNVTGLQDFQIPVYNLSNNNLPLYSNTILGESELTFDGNKLAFFRLGMDEVFYIENLNSLNSSSQAAYCRSVPLNGAFQYQVHGIEFDASGNQLFFSSEPISSTTNEVFVYRFNSNTISEVGNSQGLGKSNIELAFDGYMYAYNGTQLKGFNPGIQPISVNNDRNITINNPISSYNTFTLPDQIDGADYYNLNAASECVKGPIYYQKSTLLPSTIKVNGDIFITDANISNPTNLTQASNSINLNVGFEYKATGTQSYEAKISSCSIISNCGINSCGSGNARVSTSETININLIPYPNPISEGMLNFGKKVQQFSLYNSIGQLVTEGSNTESMNVDGLETGIYILRLDGETHKISIQ